MPARVTFTDGGVTFDADGALAPAAQLIAKLRLAIDSGAIAEGATLPSIRTGAAELGVHSKHAAQGLRRARGTGLCDHAPRLGDGGSRARRRRGGDGAEDRGSRARERARRGRRHATRRARDWSGGDAAPARAPTIRPKPPAREVVSAPHASRKTAARSNEGPAAGAPARHRARRARRSCDRRRRGSSRGRWARPSGAASGCASRAPTTIRRWGDLVWGCELVIVGRERATTRRRSASCGARATCSRWPGAAPRQVTRRPSLSSQRSSTRDALWPPKPKPFESPTRTSTPWRATFGT